MSRCISPAPPRSLSSRCLPLSLSLFFVPFPADRPHRLSTRLSRVILSVLAGRVLLDVPTGTGLRLHNQGSSVRFYKVPNPDPAPGFLSCRLLSRRTLGSQVRTGVYLLGQKPGWAGWMTTNVSPPLFLQLPSETRLVLMCSFTSAQCDSKVNLQSYFLLAAFPAVRRCQASARIPSSCDS